MRGAVAIAVCLFLVVFGPVVLSLDLADVTNHVVLPAVSADVIAVQLFSQLIVGNVEFGHLELIHAVGVYLTSLHSVLAFSVEGSLAKILTEVSALGSLAKVTQLTQQLVLLLIVKPYS